MPGANNDVYLETLSTKRQKPIHEYHRFFLLLLSFCGSIVVSFSYAFNLISRAMAVQYSLGLRDLATISTVGIAIQYFMLPYGILYDFLGPIPISAIGTTYFPLGTLLLALCFMNKIRGGTAKLSVFNAMMCSGCGQFDLASCMTIISHFPTQKGLVTALLKTYTGLGSAIVGCIYLAFFDKKPDQYFFFLMAYTVVIGVLYLIFMRLPPYHLTHFQLRRLSEEKKADLLATKAQYLRQEPPIYRFYIGIAYMVFLICFLPTEAALVTYLSLGRSYKIAFAVIAIVFTLLNVTIFIPYPCDKPVEPYTGDEKYDEGERDEPVAAEDEEGGYHYPQKIGEGGAEGEALPDDRPTGEVLNDGFENLDDGRTSAGGEKQHSRKPVETEVDFVAPQYGHPFLRSLITVELWGIWWTFFTVAGAEFVIIYNAQYILGALAGEDPSTSLSALLTVLNGVGSAVGRLVMSYFEIWTQKRPAEKRIPITIALFFPTTTIIISMVLLLVLPSAALPLPYVIAAFGNGFLAATTMLVTRTIYARDPAKHYNFCFTANMTAAILLNRFLYAEWFAHMGEKHGQKNVCYGKDCVIMPMCVMIGLAASAFLSDVIVNIRYHRYCKRVLARRAEVKRGLVEADDGDLRSGASASGDRNIMFLENEDSGQQQAAAAAQAKKTRLNSSTDSTD